METNPGVYAKVIAHSVSPFGQELATLEVQCHRFVLAEFNTHRKFSRNSASSRAIPFKKQLENLTAPDGLAMPLSWPQEKSGMQGGDELSEEVVYKARHNWTAAAQNAINAAIILHDDGKGVHKSVVNRLLEPFMWHKIIVSSTEWENFFRQRCSPLAQPEIRAVADAMFDALTDSKPVEVGYDDWHLPYVDPSEIGDEGLDFWKGVSAARCARVSYLTHDGKRDPLEDLRLYARLTSAEPPHWSPLEHVARPGTILETSTTNFDGWIQLRQDVAAWA